MASITLDMATGNSGNQSNVGFFSIKDGEEVIVRFVANSVEDFDLHTVHQMNLASGFRTLSCLRTPNEPFDKCPLCAKGENVTQRFFCKLIQYTRNADGSVNAEPKIWSRPISFAHTLKSYLDNYGPLTEIVCKIVRHGKGLDTKYEIVPNLNPQIYSPEIYVKNTSGFDGYNVVGSAITNLDFDAMVYVANNNSLPPKSNDTPPRQQFTPTQEFTSAPPQNTTSAPWELDNPTIPQAPTRYY